MGASTSASTAKSNYTPMPGITPIMTVHNNCKYCEYPEGAGGHGDELCPRLCEVCEKIKDTSCSCPVKRGAENKIHV